MRKRNIIAVILLSCMALPVSAHNKLTREKGNISGYVVDKWGNPVEGAKITTLDKSGTTVYTEKDGKFTIFVQKHPQLQIESSDKSRIIVDTDDRDEPLKIVMGYEAQAVDLGYGIVQNVGSSTVSASIVKNEEFNKRSAKNIGNSLYGYGLGLTTLQGTGEYTSAEPTLYVRGLQTLSNNSPLILVDGIERSIDYISAEEVENVTILKDAPAVALYGYRGVNGAINITTKRGKYRSREISFNYDHAINWEARRPKLADAYTYACAMNEALSNDGLAQRYSQNELDAYKSGKYPLLYPNVDWIEEAFKNTGSTNLFNLSFRGGGTKVRYYTLLNLQMNDGFVKDANLNDGYSTQNKYSKANLRTNLDIDLTKTTKLTVNLNGVLLEASRAGLSSDNIWGKIYYDSTHAEVTVELRYHRDS